jgi:hypothetical protein
MRKQKPAVSVLASVATVPRIRRRLGTGPPSAGGQPDRDIAARTGPARGGRLRTWDVSSSGDGPRLVLRLVNVEQTVVDWRASGRQSERP